MKTIRQTLTIRGATPHDVYETIMDSEKHARLSGSRTTVSRRVGAAFKVGRDLEGKNLALVADKKIVQSRHANDWAEGRLLACHVFARASERRDAHHVPPVRCA